MQRQKQAKPSQTFTFQAQAISDIVAPVVEIETKDLSPAMALTPMGDVGNVRVDVDMSVLNKAFASNFMGVKSQANKILFIIDYSASMKGRDKVMRYELCKAIDKLPAVGSVAVLSSPGQHGLRVRMQTHCIRIGKGQMVVDGNQKRANSGKAKVDASYAFKRKS